MPPHTTSKRQKQHAKTNMPTKHKTTEYDSLETDRLSLRPWRETDAASLYRYAKDPDVGTAAGWPPHTSQETSLETIRTVFAAPETYAIILKETGEPMGCCGIMPCGNERGKDMRPGDGEIGYWIGKPHWGRGLAAEAVRLLTERAFVRLGMEKLWIVYYDGNDKSRRVAEKCGFRRHHTEKDKPSPLGDIRTEHFTCLAKEEWAKSGPNLNKMSAETQRRAHAVISETGIMDAWLGAGAEVNIVGSLRMGLMMSHRDIDIHAYTKTLDVRQSYLAMAEIAAHPRMARTECRNLAHTDEACIEWHAWHEDTYGDTWQIDIMHILKGSRYDGYFEHVADRIADVMTDEQRNAILRLKYETPCGMSVMGVEYYRAVIEGGARTWDEFASWRKRNPADGIVEWTP